MVEPEEDNDASASQKVDGDIDDGMPKQNEDMVSVFMTVSPFSFRELRNRVALSGFSHSTMVLQYDNAPAVLQD